MTHSIYAALYGCIGKDFDTIHNILKETAITLFDPLWIPMEGQSPEFSRGELPAVIMYIVHAYSKESKMLIYGADSVNEKMRIAEAVYLPEYLHGKVLKLKSEVFRTVMLAYLDAQGSRAFKHLQMKKDMYEAAENQNFNNIFGKDGTDVDVKKISEAMKIKDQLLEEIQQYEEQVRSEFKHVLDNREDAQQVERSERKDITDNGNLENSPWVNYDKRNKTKNDGNLL